MTGRALLLLCALPLSSAFVKTTWKDLQGKPEYSYADYLEEFGKTRARFEFAHREAVFYRNLEAIRKHNSNPAHSWKMGLNEFSDWEEEEVHKHRTGLNKALRRQTLKDAEKFTYDANVQLPDAVDWRKQQGVVTPVKNQGGCGSCWAFSSTAVLESLAAIENKKDALVLAPQQYVDCAPNPRHCGGSGGCGGSTQPLAFNYSKTAGLARESSYPYDGRTGRCDTSRASKKAVGHKSYVELPTNDYDALMNAVATVGPISISVATRGWNSYESGVLDHCGWIEDHAVVLVGYGHDEQSGKDYWIVRNSWGAHWGEHGYIRISRYGNGKEPCGMDTNPKAGGGCRDEPNTPIQLCGTCGILSSSSYPTGTFYY